MLIRFLIVSQILLAGSQWSRAEDQTDNLRLTLPKEFYAVVDLPMSIYFDNVVLTETPEQFQFAVACDVGQTEARRWTVTPESADVGKHDLTITVSDSTGKELEKASTQLVIVPANAGADQQVKLLIVGDSLTHATAYPNELARLLSEDGNPKWRMLGTHRPSSAAKGVAHEGYGGWTWARFVKQYEPEPDGTHRKRSSPFVFLNDSGKPELIVTRYFNQHSDGERPDVVFFLLGINDCFSANPGDPPAIDARIDTMLESAAALLEDFRKAAPEADLAVCVTTPPNARQEAFEANYQQRYTRWGWKRIQHRLVERLLLRYESNADKRDAGSGRLRIVPTQLNIDPIDGYPENNGVHPNGFGYRQIGASLYSWLKWRMHHADR